MSIEADAISTAGRPATRHHPARRRTPTTVSKGDPGVTPRYPITESKSDPWVTLRYPISEQGGSGELGEGVFDGPVEGRVGVDHRPQRVRRDLGVHRGDQHREHLTTGRAGRRRPDQHATIGVLD